MVNSKGKQTAKAERRLVELGIELPPAPTPFGAYAESVQTGNLLYLSGMLPAVGHEPRFVGRLGKEFEVEQGREAAQIAALNALSAARKHLGSLDRVTKVVKLAVYLATEGDFFAQPKVADAASELLRDVFGEDKLPVRTVLGLASLPLGVPVVLEVVFEVEA
ncbi:RidA family protein [Acidicapsa acidisoli]|uniref:RidA family protein n=1 Tax=Acidicapsa acidisoli TaxID=1615681 RepID=UPI0021DF5D92|nr:RidA family protein [Acidicapsa acidisoli]